MVLIFYRACLGLGPVNNMLLEYKHEKINDGEYAPIKIENGFTADNLKKKCAAENGRIHPATNGVACFTNDKSEGFLNGHNHMNEVRNNSSDSDIEK